MGDLKGHAVPGTFFLAFGLWWAFGCLRRHLMSQRDGIKYRSTATFSLSCFRGQVGRLPLESWVKIVAALSGMLLELFAHLPSPPLRIVQHATMYFLFILTGVMDIAMYYKIPLPPGTDYVSMAIALLVEGLLFANHVHGRSELDIHIHMLLVYVVFASSFVFLLESKFQKSVMLTMARSFLTMLQGTWFWAVGIILYGHEKSTWDPKSPESVMQSTIYFSWHCAILLILLFILTWCMSCFYRERGGKFTSTPLVHVDELGNMTDDTEKGQYGILAMGDADGSDVEFER